MWTSPRYFKAIQPTAEAYGDTPVSISFVWTDWKSAFVNIFLTRTRFERRLRIQFSKIFEDLGSALEDFAFTHTDFDKFPVALNKNPLVSLDLFFPGERVIAWHHSSISSFLFFVFFFFFLHLYLRKVFLYLQITHVYTDCPSVHTNDIQTKSIAIKAYGGLDTNSFKKSA